MALFDNIQEYKKYVVANVSTNINDLLPFIDRAIELVLFSVIPVDLFDEIIEKKAIGNLTPIETELLRRMQMPAANYAQYLSIPAANVQQSSTGIHIVVNDNKKNAFQWQINQLREAAIFAASQGIDSLGAFLYKNESSFPDWANSDIEQARRRNIIGSPAELSRFVYTGGSVFLWWKLTSIMQRIQSLKLANLFASPAAWEAFLDAKQAGTLTPEQEPQLHAMQGALAALAVADGIDELCINYTSRGLVPLLAAENGLTESGAVLPAETIRHFTEKQRQTGATYIALAQRLITPPQPAPEPAQDPESKTLYL